MRAEPPKPVLLRPQPMKEALMLLTSGIGFGTSGPLATLRRRVLIGGASGIPPITASGLARAHGQNPRLVHHTQSTYPHTEVKGLCFWRLRGMDSGYADGNSVRQRDPVEDDF